jgi:hypothetical protein
MSDDGYEVITTGDCKGLIELIHHVIVLDIKATCRWLWKRSRDAALNIGRIG